MGRQVGRLGRLSRFASVGVLGLGVNVGAQIVLTETTGLHYLAAALLATQISSTTNFIGSEWWAFNADHRSGLVRRYAAFLALNNLAFVVRGPIIWSLTEIGGLFYGLSNLISLTVLTLLRFQVADRLIWRSDPNRRLRDVGLAGVDT